MLKKIFALHVGLFFSSILWAQELPPTVPPPPPDPREINVPLGEFVLDSVEGNASWPSVINPNVHISANNIQILDNSVDVMLDYYVESQPYLNVLVHGSYLTVTMDVILTDNHGFPYFGLTCSNFNETGDLIYFTGGQLTLMNKFSSIGF